MGLFLSIIMAALVAVSASLAIFGKTRDETKTPRYKQITGKGQLSIFLIVCTFGVGVWKEVINYDNSKEAEENQKIFQNTINDQNKALEYQAKEMGESIQIQGNMIIAVL